MQVLAVKDDFTALGIHNWALARLGYQALIANDGEAALKVLAMDPIRLLVSDGFMPSLNGIKLCRRLSARTPREENQCAQMEAGVDDPLRSAIQPEETGMRLRLAQRMVNLTAQGRQWYAEVARAVESVLTAFQGVANV